MTTLIEGSCGEEVRRLQHNLNAAIGQRFGMLAEDGIFGPLTEQAVITYQRLYHLMPDGIVGPRTRASLATRVLYIQGDMGKKVESSSRGNSQLPAVQNLFIPGILRSPVFGSPTAGTVAQGAPAADPVPPPVKHWVVQGQPQLMLTPPPFLFHDPSHGPSPGTVASGALQIGLVYRTASEGPHWEFGVGFQGMKNTKSQPTDPRYTMQLVGQVLYADPFATGRFHTGVFGQVVGLSNVDVAGKAVQFSGGVQGSMDIIDDHWNLFVQGGVAAQWGLGNGQFMMGPGFALGTTVQWAF